jgi:YHS domain-containing protein
MKTRRIALSALVLLTSGSLVTRTHAQAAHSSKPQPPQSSAMGMSQSSKPEGKLTKVEDHKKICMVTNKAFDKDQIPVEVEGRTYYGCCEMCKTLLTSNPDKRGAVDPVSNKKVDKSSAVIGVASNGKVLYFENEKNLDTYNSRIAQ